MRTFRQYVTLNASKDLLSRYQQAKTIGLDPLKEKTIELIRDLTPDPGASSRLRQAGAFEVKSAPSLDWELAVEGDLSAPPPTPDELIIAYDFKERNLLEEFRELILDNANKRIGPDKEDEFLSVGADPGGHSADHWCPGTGSLATFGHRSDAWRVMEIDALTLVPQAGAGGSRVNVVIIDQGLNKEAIKATHPRSWGGGWQYRGKHGDILPGSAEARSHGMLIARNVLDIAPDAVVYDMPLIPRPRISKVPLFAHSAQGALYFLLLCIDFLRQYPRWSGPWIFVNAWAIYDRSSEDPLGDYTEDLHPSGHRLNKVVARAQAKNVDVVFAAGNCGAFCPSPRCGALDRGAGRSIWGANSSPAVITVGAVVTSEMWLGYSSQGPGQQRLDCHKPDLCAPSQFRETIDAHMHNTGTSTACALTAGVVAALRTRWDAATLPPHALKQALVDTARKIEGNGWNARLGHGVLNAGAAFRKLAGMPDEPHSSSAPSSPQPYQAAPQAVSFPRQESVLTRALLRLANLIKRVRP